MYCFRAIKKTPKDGLMQNATSYNYELVGTEKILSYVLDNETKYSFSALFPYTDKSGREYLTFLNSAFFQVLFYDLNSEDFLFKIQSSGNRKTRKPANSGGIAF